MQVQKMENSKVVDHQYDSKTVLLSTKRTSYTSEDGNALDLRLPNTSRKLDLMSAPYTSGYLENARPSVIIANAQFSLSQRSRWNHRSHPSIDSDSSFESEQESDVTRCSSSESFRRRESVTTDTENDSEAHDSSSPLSKGLCKDLSALTANVSIGKERRDSMIFQLSACRAEIVDPEDVHSELKSTVQEVSSAEEDSDDANDNCLQINETETYLEELFKIQTVPVNNSSELTQCIRAGIQATASKYIKEIRNTRMDIPGLNLVVDGKKKQRCMKCNEVFYSVAALLKHLMTHSSRNPGEKLIRCPVCVKRFATLTTLEMHIQRIHLGDLKYVCEVCDLPFKFSTHLRRHLLNTRCGKGTKKSP